MRINQTNQILLGMLLLQVILAVIIFFPNDEEAPAAGQLLTDFTPAEVTKVTVSADAVQTVTMTKNSDGTWVLPDYGDFPVDPTRITNLLDKLALLQANRIITRSDTSHRRLKVAEDDFQRKVELEWGDQKQTLYIGNTGGGNAIHVRLGNSNDVYLVGGLAATDANGAISNWINASYLTVPVADVVELELENANGTLKFIKNGETWTLDGLAAGETFAADQFTTFLNQATAIRMSEPVGKEELAEFGMAEPRATLTIRTRTVVATPTPEAPEVSATVEATSEVPATAEATSEPTVEGTPAADTTPEPEVIEKTYTFQVGAVLDKGVVVKSSESEYYVLIIPTNADNFVNKIRDNFLILPPTPTPAPTEAAPPATVTP